MPTAETHSFTLPSGAKIEIQTLPGHGAWEVRSDGETRNLAKILAPLGEVAQLVLDQVRAATRGPDEVKVELGAAIKGKSTLVLVTRPRRRSRSR